MTVQTLLWRYSAFAVIATIVNLGIQRVVLGLDDTMGSFVMAVAAGTLGGLVVKYILDKRWIFYDLATGARAHGEKFSRYTTMGLITTAIFWGTETAFWLIWQSDLMRELGAIIGLSIGYAIKYQLDRRYVFTDGRLEPAA